MDRVSPRGVGSRLLGQTIPHPTKVRWEGLGLTPREAFVLSQIDGVLCLDEVAEISGLPVDAVCAIAERLEVLGAVRVAGRGTSLRGDAGRYATHVAAPATASKKASPETRRTRKPPKRASAAPRDPREESPPSSRRKSEAPRSQRPEKAPLRPTAKPAARATARPGKSMVDGASALDLQLLEAKNHYGVLGVARTATAEEIELAHAARSRELPPDAPERLGARLREAFEVLRDPARRAEYDQYLALTRTSMRMERALAPVLHEPPAVVARPVLSVRGDPAPAPAPTPTPAPPAVAAEPAVADAEPDVVVTVVESSTEPPPAASEPPVASPPPTPSPPQVAPASPTPPTPRASDPARWPRQTDRAAEVLKAAQQALIAGDAVAAANHYRLALEFAGDASARGYAESGLREARTMLFDMHVKKGRYEEKEGHWPDAVQTYEKALALRPDDPAMWDRLANALRQVGTDLERATLLGEAAVTRVPRRAAYRTTLGLVYAAAGVRAKAVDQLERALVLDPSDATAQHALDALRKRR